MQQQEDHMGPVEEELQKTKQQLSLAEEERDQAIDEFQEMKKVAQEANMKLGESIPHRKVSGVYEELNTLKETLSNLSQELKIKDKNIESLKRDLEKAKKIETKLAEKDASLIKMEEELKSVKSSALDSSSEIRKRVEELEAELQKEKESEAKMFDSIVSQTKVLEQTKISLEESKLEVATLREKMENSLSSPAKFLLKESLQSLNAELQLSKQNLVCAMENEKLAFSKAQNIAGEMELLKNELNLAMETEVKSKKAMDDLVLALSEVATECNQTKEKLEQTKEEAELLKTMIKNTEDSYKNLLDEAKKESDQYKNTGERLRLEAEDTLMAWNGKEMGFVGCIKKVEEENLRLRDILKQALNEANVAKEAAGIAKNENSQLQDSLSEKDNVLDLLSREIEKLKTMEANALVRKKNGRSFSFDLNELRFPFTKHHHKDLMELPSPAPHHRRKSSAVIESGESMKSEDFDRFGDVHYDDSLHDLRKKRALLRRLSDLFRRSYHKRDEVSVTPLSQ